jgi:hypothetical protein
MQVRTTRRRYHHPAPVSPHQVAHEVIGKLIAPMPGHDVLRPQWAAAAPYLCNCVHAVDHMFDLAFVGHRPEIMRMTPGPYIPAIVTVTQYFAVCFNEWLSMAIRQAVTRIGTTFYSPNHPPCASPKDGLFTSLRYRPSSKRCVVPGLVENGWWRCALVSGLWVWSGLCWGSAGMGDVGCGQMGTGDVVGDGREAG